MGAGLIEPRGPVGSFVTATLSSGGGGGTTPSTPAAVATSTTSPALIVVGSAPLEVTRTTALGTGTVQAGADPVAITCLVTQSAGGEAVAVPASPPAAGAGVSAAIACPVGDLRPGSRYSLAITARSANEVRTSNGIGFTTAGPSANLITAPKRIKSRGLTVLLPEARFTASGAPVRVSVTARSEAGPSRFEVLTDPSGRVAVRTFDDAMTLTITYTASNPSMRTSRTYQP